VPTVKLTRAAVEGIEAPDRSGRQAIYWDADLKGFGVLASGTGNTKTFVVQKRLPDGRTRRVTIGRTNVFDLDRARREAVARLLGFANGGDPKADAPPLGRIFSSPQPQPRPRRWGKLIGIYFLFLGLQYVGQTIDAFRRVGQHRRSGKVPFDCWRFLPAEVGDLGVLEETYIRTHRPPHNAWRRSSEPGPAPKPVLLKVMRGIGPRRAPRGVQMNLL
jgi:hypothetical protein